MNNSQVAHLWANQSRSSAKGSNFFFDGDKLYSYGRHFCVGRIVNGTAILNNGSYSVSTSKHQGYARYATHHLPKVYCNDPSDFALANKEHVAAQIKGLLIEHSAPRIRQVTRDKIEVSINHLVDQFNEYLAALPKDERKSTPKMLPVVIEKAKVKLKKEIASELRERQLRIERAAQMEKERQLRMEKERDEKIERANAYNVWWVSDTSLYCRLHAQFAVPPVLRIKENVIQTSHGAEIPLSMAETLWKMIKRTMKSGADQMGVKFQVGDYRLDNIYKDGSIKVGCHDIAFSELKRIAKELNFI